MSFKRTDAWLALAVSLISTPILAQTAPSVTAPPSASIWAAPTTAPAAAVPRPSSAASAAPDVAPVNQPFVATISGDNVYVRSGPGAAYYEMGKLDKGDSVYVVASSKGWYQILPPNGSFCLIAKEFVEPDVTGSSGTVKADFVNVRAGTALYKDRDPSAVLCVVRKGTKVSILTTPAADGKYFTIAPPEKAYVYINPQFLKTAPGLAYKIPDLKLPNGLTGPAVNTVTTAGISPPSIEIAQPGATIAEGPTIQIKPPAASGATPPSPPTPDAAADPAQLPKPAIVIDEAATARFTELNTRFQQEAKKPAMDEDVNSLIADYKELLSRENLSPSVKTGAQARLESLEKVATVQRLAKENDAANQALADQRRTLDEQKAAADKLVADYLETGAFLAEGTLQTSTVVSGKYALVNLATGRVLAYVDPIAKVDISKLVGQYIGVRGTIKKLEGSDLNIIEVDNATLLPTPSPSPSIAGAGN